jgi:hypothetical protein
MGSGVGVAGLEGVSLLVVVGFCLRGFDFEGAEGSLGAAMVYFVVIRVYRGC